MSLALENLCDPQHQSCCIPEDVCSQPSSPLFSQNHDCLCCFPPAFWAPEVWKSPAGITQNMPHARGTLGSFSWQRLTGYWPGCLSFPTQDWHWPLQLVLPIISCCPSATLPCSLCSQLTWSLLALATCQDTSQQPPRCFSCSEKLYRAGRDHSLRKKLVLWKDVLLSPPSQNTQKNDTSGK